MLLRLKNWLKRNTASILVLLTKALALLILYLLTIFVIVLSARLFWIGFNL
jgi:hypothetical protein